MKGICECCVKGKLTRKPFPQGSETTTEDILDLIHTDICGPMQISTPKGNRYVMTIIDDFSRYSEVYFLKNKSEAKSYIKKFIEAGKTQNLKTVKLIRSDR